jgi:integral membrane protein
MLKSALHRFRIISYIEGLSYLTLLFIAMPIKYIGENPYPVKIIGMTHGVLFILFMIFLLESIKKHSWENKFGARLFVYSIIPFGSFFIEKKIKELI